jgi:alginate O-acetyltransferase complex protein AlgI
MVFSSPFFIFVFLPLVLFLIALFPKRFHNIILLTASLFFYSWGGVSYLIIFIISIVFNYFSGIFISVSEGKKAKILLGIVIAFNLLLLGYFKYFNFFVENINALVWGGAEKIEIKNIALPIGISFFTFHALSYVIDLYRKKVTAQRNFVNMSLYMMFFPQLIAGPIVRYIDIEDQLSNRNLNLAKASSGIQRFIFGLSKKVIIANTMASLADQIFAVPTDQISAGLSWLGIIAYTLQIYFDFSGYSDMAIGLATVFGFHFPENFNYPYIAKSIKEFWRRWHISLSTWFRDFLYIPLGGNKKGKTRTLINLLIVFFCTGFWHGASWNFIVWGLFHGMFLLLERIGWEKILVRLWRPVSTAYTLLIVIIGWVFFRAETLPQAIRYLSRMSFIPSHTHLEIMNVWQFLDAKIILVLIIGILYSFRIFRSGSEVSENIFIKNNKKESFQFVFQTAKVLFSILLLVVTLSYLAAETYNPFIYFRF